MLNPKEQQRLDNFKSVNKVRLNPKVSTQFYRQQREYGDDIRDFEEKERQKIADAVGIVGNLPSSLRR
jgi:hypothetical protein